MKLNEQIKRIKQLILLSEGRTFGSWKDDYDDENDDEYDGEHKNINDGIYDFYDKVKINDPDMNNLLFHGTNQSPWNFEIKDDFSRENGREDKKHFPENYFFLTPDINTAERYGRYIIPFTIDNYESNLTFHTKKPAYHAFADDYSGDIKKWAPNEYVGYWEKFIESGKKHLIIKDNSTSIVITHINNMRDRSYLAKEFYG